MRPCAQSRFRIHRSRANSINRFYEPPDSYESKHRWDPKATWTEEEEKKLDRKLDWRIMFFACVCFFSLCLDRSNVSCVRCDYCLLL